MREIKYRGLTVSDRQWISSDEEFHEVYLNHAEKTAQVNGLWVKYDSVSQFTGLKDKNGKEIYESDILHVLEVGSRTLEYSSVVEFIESGFLVTEPDGTQVPLACFHNEENAIMPLFEIEVIGNIYEHSHLLEGTE